MKNSLNVDRLFGWFLLCSIIFQATGILPNADTQPNFIILSSLFLLIYLKDLKYDIVSVITFIVCYVCLLVAFSLQAEHITLKYFLTYTVSLLSFLFVFILVKNEKLNFTSKFLIIVTAVYAFVGAVQFFIPDFLSFMVSRSVDAALSFADSGRGSRSLTGEPSHLGKVFIILNVLFLFSRSISEKPQVNPNQLILATILFLLINFLIARSFYAIFTHTSILLILIFFMNRVLFSVLLIVFVLFSSAFIVMMSGVSSDIRFVSILNILINDPSALLNQGAMRRVLNIPLSLNNLLHFDWYGSGSNPKTFQSTIDTPLGVLHYIGSNRGYGGVIEFALKFGFLSIPLFVTYFLLLFRISFVRTVFNGKSVSVGLFFALSIFILTFQDGALAKPLPMFLLAYIYINRFNLRNVSKDTM